MSGDITENKDYEEWINKVVSDTMFKEFATTLSVFQTDKEIEAAYTGNLIGLLETFSYLMGGLSKLLPKKIQKECKEQEVDPCLRTLNILYNFYQYYEKVRPKGGRPSDFEFKDNNSQVKYKILFNVEDVFDEINDEVEETIEYELDEDIEADLETDDSDGGMGVVRGKGKGIGGRSRMRSRFRERSRGRSR